MKIKYLKPAPNAITGDIKDINTAQANILIQLGFAKEYDEKDTTNDDLFGQLDDNQNTKNEPPATNQEPPKADETTETAKPKKTKKTNTENN